MAPQAVLIFFFFAVISDLVNSFALFDTGHETTALRLSFVLPSFHVWLCLYLLQIQGQEFLIVFVLVFYISI